MKYGRIIGYVNDTPWALLDSKLHEVVCFLRERASGVFATAEELEAFTGGQPPARQQQGAVAVIPVRGVIAHRAGMLDESSGGVSTESLARMYKQAMADPNVSAVVLDFDSPGGAVAGLHELAAEMLALKGTKRVVAVANSLMASAAYWLAAAAADEIVAIPSASVGSIGVASIYIDDSKQREQDGVAVTVFTSAENKAEGLGLGPLSEDAKARRQARVDEAGAWFRSDVAKGRGLSVADVKAKFGEGIVFGAKGAKDAGLVDRIATMDKVIGELVGRKAPAGIRVAVVGDNVRATFHAEDETMEQTEARMEAPAFGQVRIDEERAARLRLL